MQSITVDEAFIKLSSQGWLADVDAEQQDLLKSIASIRCVAAEQRIFEIEGDPLAVVGIVSGSVRLSMVRPTGDEYTLFRPGPGFWVGHYAVLNDAPHLLACTAAEPTVVVWLPKRRLLQLVNTELNLYKAFSKLTYRHMGNVLDLVAGMTLQDSIKRVASRLLAEDWGRKSSDGWVPLSQSEFAEMLSMSLPTLQRAMSKLASKQLIEIGYGRVRLLDREGLTALTNAAS